MRILHIFDHSLPLQSGYVSRSLGILRSQRDRGWETVHITASRHAAWTRQDDAAETFGDLTFHRTALPALGLPLLQQLAEMRLLRRRIAKIVASERPDLIHAHSPLLNVLPAIAVGRRCNLPVIYEVRAFWEDAAVDHGRLRESSLRYQLARRLDTWAMRRADAVLPICEPMRAEMIARGIPAARLTVVPNAIDGGLLAPAASDGRDIRRQFGLEDRFVIGFIGSFYSYEGLDLLLEAVAMLRPHFPKIAVLLVGGGPDEPRLRGMIEQLNLGDAVTLVGRVEIEAVPRYYQAVDLCVFPRRRMRLTELVTPLKPLEAMAQRKPVAASDVGGHRELIRHAETGYLFAADDAAALAASIRSLMGNTADCARITANARRYVEKDRSWAAISARYAAIYGDLLDRTNARPVTLPPAPVQSEAAAPRVGADT